MDNNFYFFISYHYSFPPFEFGNEIFSSLGRSRVGSSRTSGGSDFGKLPIKEYDFIFNNNKKAFPLNNNTYYLQRRLLFSELIVEYILAFIISILVGYTIKYWESRKKEEVELASNVNDVLSPKSKKHKNFAQILIENSDEDSDQLYNEAAKSYGFGELEIPIGQIPKSEIEWMKEKFNSLDSSIKQMMISQEILLYKIEKVLSRYIYKFFAVNPTSDYVAKISFAIASGNVGYDIIVIKKDEFNKLLQIITSK